MIQEYRKQSVLNTKLNYNGEIMTRLEFLTKMKANGATVEEKQKRNFAAEEKLEAWIYDHRDYNSGNENWPDTKLWLEKKEQLKAGIFKTVYYLHPSSGHFFEITKTEYDKFLELEELQRKKEPKKEVQPAKLIVIDKGDPSVGIFEHSFEIDCPFFTNAEQDDLDFFREQMIKMYQEYSEGKIIAYYPHKETDC